jgi:hypothetical protein
MNIFVLDENIDLCAQYHVDKHCVKMILETTQLLNNAVVAHDTNYTPIYKPTHQKHPCSIWATASRSNFEWLNQLGLALCHEYTYRYHKRHKCHDILDYFSQLAKERMPDSGLTKFAVCMPEEYKVEDPILSYRNYYRGAKAGFAKWTNREAPEWWKS